MNTAEPVTQVETTAVEAAVCPLVIVSPSVNVSVALFVPLFLYLTNSVSGSVPSVATNPTTSATTPDELPVSVLSLYNDSVPLKEVSFTAL